MTRTVLKNTGYSCIVILLTGLTLVAVYFLPGSRMDYNRWDNYEYFTPMITFSQNCWLTGDIPYWNPHQLMGEPVIATGQAGPLYLPYFLSVLLMQTFNLPPGMLCMAIVAIHIPFAVLGWFLTLKTISIRKSFCLIISLGICFGGFITLISMVWIFMMPVFTLLPWTLLGLLLILKEEKWITGSIIFILALAGQAYIGHPQMLVYSWLFAFIYAVVFTFFVFRKSHSAVSLLFCFFVALLISLPPVLPVLKAMTYSSRNEAFSRDEFLGRNLSKENVPGFLLPLYKNTLDGFSVPMWAYQGAWFMPGFLAGASTLLIRLHFKYRNEINRKSQKHRPKKNRPGPHLQGSHDAFMADKQIEFLKRIFFFSWFPGLLFLLFALGKEGVIYEWTYGIPVWSSFRWPLKFCCYCFPALAFPAGIGLELWTRFLEKYPLHFRWRLTMSLIVCGLAVVLLLTKPVTLPLKPFWGVSLISSLPFLGLLGWIDRRPLRQLLFVLSMCNVIAFQALCHNVDYQRYKETYGSVGPRQLHIDQGWRTLPVTIDYFNNNNVQWLGLSDSATVNGYDSFSGIPAGVIPSWYQFPIPVNLLGSPDRKALNQWFYTNLMHSLNIRYILASPSDKSSRSILSKVGSFPLLFQNDKVVVLENPNALPRAYFACNLQPFSEPKFLEGMMMNKSPVASAFIENYSGPQTTPAATVHSLKESSSRIEVQVDAPLGGFLVVSVSYYPDWKVIVDGTPATLCRVNKRVMGVHVPAGARMITFQYHSRELFWGCLATMIGAGLFSGWVFWVHKNKPVCSPETKG